MTPPSLSAATREKLLRRVEAEMAGGRPWKAKEVLRGAMPQLGMDAVAFERYGQVLEALGEALEAGKYYFLSGVRRPEYQGCIDLFVARHRRASLAHLVAQFPTTIKRLDLEHLPPTVADDLRSLGLPHSTVNIPVARICSDTGSTRSNRSGRFGLEPWQAFGALVFWVLFVSMLVGLYHIVGWIFGTFMLLWRL